MMVFIGGNMSDKISSQILGMAIGFMAIVGMLIVSDMTDSATINNMPYRPTPHTTAVATQVWGNWYTSQQNDTALNTQLNAISTVAVACASRTPIPTCTPVPTLPTVTPIPPVPTLPTATPIPADTPVAIDPLSVTSLVVNDGGEVGKNTRIETDSQEYAFYLDATNNRIMLGIGTPHPDYYAGYRLNGYVDMGNQVNRIGYTFNSASTLNFDATLNYQANMTSMVRSTCSDGKTGTAYGFAGESYAVAAATPTATPPRNIGVLGIGGALPGWEGIGVVGYTYLQNSSGTLSNLQCGVAGMPPVEPTAGTLQIANYYCGYFADPQANGNVTAGYSVYSVDDVYIGGNVNQSAAVNGSYYHMPYGGTPTPAALEGQTRYSTDWKTLSVHDGTRWRPVGFESMGPATNNFISTDETAFYWGYKGPFSVGDLDKAIIIFGIHASSNKAPGSGDTIDVEVRVDATPSALNARLTGDTQTGASDYVDAGVTVAAGSSFTVNCNVAGGAPETDMNIAATIDYITLW
jgi:hypothetical protein